jgi:hypothetical protein
MIPPTGIILRDEMWMNQNLVNESFSLDKGLQLIFSRSEVKIFAFSETRRHGPLSSGIEKL